MNELATQESHLPVTVAEMKAQVNRIQEIMHAVMQDGIHYGKVPGHFEENARAWREWGAQRG